VFYFISGPFPWSVVHIGGCAVPEPFVITAMIAILEFGADGEGSFRWSHSQIFSGADVAGAAFLAFALISSRMRLLR
jgi:hypothetical protein